MTAVGKTAPASGASAQRGRAPDEALQAAVARGDAAGIVAMAADRAGLIYQGAFGVADLETQRPLQLDALFRIASMTKAITSVAAMQLIEEGRLGLDDPVERHLPEFAGLQVVQAFDPATGAYTLRPATRTVTVRHLFTHTSGLGYPFTSPTVRDFRPRPGEERAVGPLMFEPGTQWLYSTSTDWLGRVVEAITGGLLEDHARRHIFAPLGMEDTFYYVPEAKHARVAAIHRRTAAGGLVKEPNQGALTGFVRYGGGGMTSTAADYIRFTRMLLNGGEFEGVRVLSAASVAAMGQSHIGDVVLPMQKTALPDRSEDFSFIAEGRDTWGLGFQITGETLPGRRAAGSLSWGGINNTYYWIDPVRGITGVILMQHLPFADRKALAVYEAFERAVYRLTAER